MPTNTYQQDLKQLSVGLGLLGVLCGFLAAYGVIAGDAEGRVNLLYLLLLFAFLPIAGLLFSVFLLLKGGGKGLAGWILEFPLWPRHMTLSLAQLGPAGSRKLWLFYQTQILAVAFSAGCLLLYLLLLLGSDITFVWRSTLLQAEDLLPALSVISLPWSFWPEAQASLALLEQTQDFRLDPQAATQSGVGLWWQYILAAQLTYNLIPRSVMLLIARQKYRRQLRALETTHSNSAPSTARRPPGDDLTLADLSTSVSLPYTLLDWACTPADLQQQVQQQLGEASEVVSIGPLPRGSDEQLPNNISVVLLVKSWEPPLAELADRLESIASTSESTDKALADSTNSKVILPLDWNDNGLQQPTSAHLDEWRRFAATLPGWQVLQLEASS